MRVMQQEIKNNLRMISELDKNNIQSREERIREKK